MCMHKHMRITPCKQYGNLNAYEMAILGAEPILTVLQDRVWQRHCNHCNASEVTLDLPSVIEIRIWPLPSNTSYTQDLMLVIPVESGVSAGNKQIWIVKPGKIDSGVR